MALARRERFEFPDLWRRFFDLDLGAEWMRVEEFMDDKTLVVRAELPGIDPDKDVELSVTDNMLHIRAEREERTEDKEKETYRSEFRYGSFVRNIPLPVGTAIDDVKASYKDGILEVRVPMTEVKQATTKIPVNRS